MRWVQGSGSGPGLGSGAFVCALQHGDHRGGGARGLHDAVAADVTRREVQNHLPIGVGVRVRVRVRVRGLADKCGVAPRGHEGVLLGG